MDFACGRAIRPQTNTIYYIMKKKKKCNLLKKNVTGERFFSRFGIIGREKKGDAHDDCKRKKHIILFLLSVRL